ncbi:hypothetical protein SAY87_008118 [Trapa incisa]|uniref:Uncharacterized protein n=1 Tax=Trapa incisa TaxID=236973 RepID=A0AAN7KLS8_9MYRT|nr:hypothetical protein SAY87_008118 [Trapa incisa]
MASTSCFLHHLSLTPARTASQRCLVNLRCTQIVCKAQKQTLGEEDVAVVSRRLALTVLIGATAVGSKVSPADAAYGEAGASLYCLASDCPLSHSWPEKERHTKQGNCVKKI